MSFRIETEARGGSSVFILSGHLETQAIAELTKLFALEADHSAIVVDLKDVNLVDRKVMQFFMGCEADGVTIEHCAPYLREWMEREKDCG